MIKKLAERFFQWYCHPDYYEDIQGDLDELYQRKLTNRKQSTANWYFAAQVLLLFRPSIIRPFRLASLQNNLDMFINYLKIGYRNLRKNPSYTTIHIFGLALGLTAFLFINQYTSFEKSYDQFHPLSDQLYRLSTDELSNGKVAVTDAMTFAPAAHTLTAEVPEVLSGTTIHKPGRLILKKGNTPLEENNIVAADSNFLNLFNYPIIYGDLKTMLIEPHSIVLTKSLAKKYFSEENPVGQYIEVLGGFNRPFKVTGVIEDIPDNTHCWFDILVSLRSFAGRIQNDQWSGYNYYGYVRLAPETDLDALYPKLQVISDKYRPTYARTKFRLMPVKDIHLESDFTYEPQIHGSKKAVGFLGIISIFILLIAWVNYVNLSTARAIERAKEVGIRKVVGAARSHLLKQFLTEALIINFFGAIMALVIAQALFPYFNELVGKNVVMDLWQNPDFLIKLGLFFAFGTLITGFYPAMVLSSFKPIGVLKGSFTRSKHGTNLRKGLVVVQFAASLILVASTIIVYQQIQYMTANTLGINTQEVIGFENPEYTGQGWDKFVSNYKAFSEEINKIPGVKNIAGIDNLPGGNSTDINSSSSGFRIGGKQERVEATIYMTYINDNYVETVDLELLAGRNFNAEMAGDSNTILVNETFMKMNNYTDPSSIVNEKVIIGSNPNKAPNYIVGVVKDYNRSSLKSAVEPTIFFPRKRPTCSVVKLTSNDANNTIVAIQDTWNQFYPQTPFIYSFLDKRFEKLYVEDLRFGSIFLNFALLAILVATIGLFGLSSYLALQRTKEVGVRKVLGASVNQIVLLFFKDFFVLIIVSVFISLPITYLGMNGWLNSYAYRIDFPWLLLLVAILGMLLVAFVTVSIKTWRLASLNPSKTIRYE
ncbi:MAG: FtsX-like permease family protein [Bacteroidota bacterium]